MKSLQYYRDLCKEIIKQSTVVTHPNRYSRIDLYAKIDEAYACYYKLPDALSDLPWIGERKFVSTMVGDAIDAGTRTFATLSPNINIMPTRANEGAWKRSQTIEGTMEWYFERMNRGGRKSPHWKIVANSMKYCATAVQVEYLPHRYAGREKEPMIKYLLSQKKFDWHVHHPGTVHTLFNNDIPSDVVKCVAVTGKFLLEEFGEDNAGVKKMVLEIGAASGDMKKLLTTWFTYYDYSNWTDRVQWATRNPEGQTSPDYEDKGGREVLEFRREPHGLPFINWIVVDHEDPITKSIFNAGLWENANDLRAMEYSKAVEMVAHPSLWIVTEDGTLKRVHLDYKSVIQPLVTTPQARVTPLNPPQIDPQLAKMVAKADSEIAQSTVAQILSSSESINSVQNYSLYNAILQAAIGQLSLAKTCGERTLEGCIYQEFQWLDHKGDVLLAYYPGTSRRDKARGKVLRISARDFGEDVEQFNLTDLYLSVELRAQSLTDEQARLNTEITRVERLGGSRRSAYDALGRKDYELDRNLRAEEDMWDANKAADVKRVLAEQEAEQAEKLAAAQAKGQAAGQPALPGMEQTPENMVNEMNAGGQFAGAEGMDGRGGGFAPQGVAPGNGREQITGRSNSGQEAA
jgi:hypothetical protein